VTLQERAKKIVSEVVKTAEGIEAPPTSDFFDYMFAELPEDLKRQRDTMRTSSLGLYPEQAGLRSASRV
jgi:TPP-dependent pyruvate/acetoin dehydrogenase alpha subunit